jgi:hypothetical protein
VLGLPGGQRGGGDQQRDPRAEDEPLAPSQEAVEPEHEPLHPSIPSFSRLASQPNGRGARAV